LTLGDDFDLESCAWFSALVGIWWQAFKVHGICFERSKNGLLVLLQKVEVFGLSADYDPFDIRA
jgi:hypothetical protein